MVKKGADKKVKNRQRQVGLVKKLKEEKTKDRKRIKKLKKEGKIEKKDPLTTDAKREITEEVILENNPDLNEEEAFDEFATFINHHKKAKILLTTSLRPSKYSFGFLMDLKNSLPNSFYYPRKKHSLIKIAELALKKDFTHMISLNERNKSPYSLAISVLKTGPTLHYRVRNYIPSYQIYNKGNPTAHNPEIILKNFNTALGRRVARGMASLFDNTPEFKGRTVVTFHNQRDFLFFRHHRYIFSKREGCEEDEELTKRIRVDLQEIGPRFSLQLQKFHDGCYDEFRSDYEFNYRADYYVKRNRFYL